MLKKEAKLSRHSDEKFAYELMINYAKGGNQAIKGPLENRGYNLPKEPEEIQETEV